MVRLLSIVALAALVLVAGCAKEVAPAEETVIRIGKEKLTRGYLDNVEEAFRQNMSQMQPDLALFSGGAMVRKNAAREVVASKLMLSEARKRQVPVSPESVEQAYSEFREKLGPVQLKKEIEASGRTEESFREYLSEGMMVDSLMKQILERAAPVSDSVCRAFYEANKERFVVPGKIRISHIFVPGGQDSAAAQSTITAVKKRLDSGADFGAQAKAYSQDPNAAKGGDMGWFARGDILPQIENAAFALKVNQNSDIVRTEAGYHLVRKTGEKEAEQGTYDEFRGEIRDRLAIAGRMQTISAFIDSLIVISDVEYVDTSYAPLPAQARANVSGL